MNHDCLAELAGVKKQFGKVVALDGLDLQVRRGELLALLGPNGAGKTTAVSMLLGLQRPDSGTARLLGHPPQRLAVRRFIGVMLQEVGLAEELRVREHIDLVASYYPHPLPVDTVMQMTLTTSLAERPYRKLSAGQKRQAQLAVALCGGPRLLFLDEPTVGLDVQTREAMWSTLRNFVSQGTSVVLTTHYLEEAEALADRVAVLSKGRIIAMGTVAQMRALVARRHVICSTKLTFEQVADWPGVESVIRTGHRLQITTCDVETVTRLLLNADASVHDLEVHRAGLAEAFTELTQKSDQEEMRRECR